MKINPKILFFTDFSENSSKALIAAEEFRKLSLGTMHLVHFAEFSFQWDWVDTGIKEEYLNLEIEKQRQANLEREMLEQIRDCEAKATGSIVKGDLKSSFNTAISLFKPDILILGHTGKGKSSFLVGGFASNVIGLAAIPIMLIKNAKKPLKVAGLVDTAESVHGIIHSTFELSNLFSAPAAIISLWRKSFSDFFNQTAYEKDMAPLLLSEFERRSIQEKMREKIQENLPATFNPEIIIEISEEKRLAFHLIKILDQKKVDLIVIQKHHKTFIEKFLVGSETRRLVEFYPGDIFILPS
jgi:nucleotide-binding universal stress UspA family protein